MNIELKKLYTKKKLKKFYSSNRSKVGLIKNTGTITMKSKKDYNRQKVKQELKEYYYGKDKL